MPPSVTNEKHLFGADVLRGIAILMVVAYHAFGRAYGFFLPWSGHWRDFSNPPSALFTPFYPISFGWAGVALFFVLSGFCIHLSFLRAPGFTTASFFWRRFWRIYPAYLVALVAFSVLSKLDLTSIPGIKMFLSHALLIHNAHSTSLFGINPSFWSIATEVQLYLLYPILLLARQRFGLRSCLIGTFAVGLAWRTLSIAAWGLPDHVINAPFASPFMTWFDWALGAYVAECAFRQEPAFSRHWLWLAALLAAFIFSTLYRPLTIFSFTLAASASAFVLDLLLQAQPRRSLPWRLAGYIGLISYSIYLWHQPLLDLLWRAAHPFLPAWITMLLVGGIIALVSYCSYKLIELRGIGLGKVLWSSVRPRPASSLAIKEVAVSD
jgi:peptidoglycan/LPS O-acetylase OafA/YrhL